jgi:hypothetical protein
MKNMSCCSAFLLASTAVLWMPSTPENGRATNTSSQLALLDVGDRPDYGNNESDLIAESRRQERFWKRLEMTEGHAGVPPSEERVIKRIKITLNGKDDSPMRVSLVGKARVVYETKDRRVLKAINTFLDLPFRYAIPANSSVGGGAYVLGTVVVTTNRDEFPISITTTGFQLEEGSASFRTMFYSWGLAHFLDDVCFEATRAHIPAGALAHLTGEDRFASERVILQELNARKTGDAKSGGAKKE